MAVRRRYIDYQTTLPTSGGGLSSRRILASIASGVFHIALVLLAIRLTTAPSPEAKAQAQQTERPVQLLFNPPPQQPRPQPQPVEPVQQPPELVKPPEAPLTPGEDQTPGTTARVVPDPEQDPNAAPDAKREEATRPDPGDQDASSREQGTSETAPVATSTAPPQPTAESEAKRIFGRPSALLGPSDGSRSSRPWEATQANSNGCKIPEEEQQQDSTLPKGMASVSGRIFREDNGKPLGGARLQIIGTQYGTFSNDAGDYKLVFDRTLVDRCRTQSVRVTAPGYRGRDVLLYLGDRSTSDVPLSRW